MSEEAKLDADTVAAEALLATGLVSTLLARLVANGLIPREEIDLIFGPTLQALDGWEKASFVTAATADHARQRLQSMYLSLTGPRVAEPGDPAPRQPPPDQHPGEGAPPSGSAPEQ